MSNATENEKKVTEKEEVNQLNMLVFNKLTKLAAEESSIKHIYQFLIESIDNCPDCKAKDKGCKYHRAFAVEFNQRVVNLILSAKDALNQIATMYRDQCQPLLINENNPRVHLEVFNSPSPSVQDDAPETAVDDEDN